MIFKRPVIFFDIESTGINPQTDRIVQICIVKVLGGDFDNAIEKVKLINPGIPIPKQASDVHGITDEMVKDSPRFKQLAKGIHDFIFGCDIIGYNSLNFDCPLLYNELQRAGITWDYTRINFIDVCNIFKRKEERTLSAAVKFYCEKEHTEAHDALGDVRATMEVFTEQIEQYELYKQTAEELALFSNYDRPILDIAGRFTTDGDGDVIFNFGKHKDKKARTEPSYLEWMITKGDFSQDTINIAKSLI